MQVELKSIQREVGITFVFVTHDQGEALSMSNRIAVFNNGRIEQVGSPREIYDSPATAFVAGFVGTSNVLSADLSARLLGSAQLHSLRPERIRVVLESVADTEISVEGKVADLQYLGADCRIRTDLPDGSQLLATVPSDGLVGVAIGGPIRLAWSHYAAYTVADTQTSEGGDQ
jgi:putative spermidine/putrescine transport system ATP-binding protein